DLKEKVETLWTVVERKKQNEPVFKLPPDGVEIITTMEKNDMFLLGINSEDIDWSNQEVLSKILYKVQKISGGDYFFEFCFRHHLDSRPDKEAKKDYKYIKNFGDGVTGWYMYNPIKVKITRTGKIEPV